MGVKDFIFDLVEGGKNIDLFGGGDREPLEPIPEPKPPTPKPGEFIPSDVSGGLREGEGVKPLGDSWEGMKGQMEEGIVTSHRDLKAIEAKQLHERLAAEGVTLSPDNKAFESLPQDSDIFKEEVEELSPEQEYEKEVMSTIEGAGLNEWEANDYREWLKGHNHRLKIFNIEQKNPEYEPGHNAATKTARFWDGEMRDLEKTDWGKKVGSWVKQQAEEEEK